MECSIIFIIKAQIAQLVEQWIEDPRVPSSNLGLGIFLLFTISVNFNDEAAYMLIKLKLFIQTIIDEAIAIQLVTNFNGNTSEESNTTKVTFAVNLIKFVKLTILVPLLNNLNACLSSNI